MNTTACLASKAHFEMSVVLRLDCSCGSSCTRISMSEKEGLGVKNNFMSCLTWCFLVVVHLGTSQAEVSPVGIGYMF